MKNIILLTLLSVFGIAEAQVTIEKTAAVSTETPPDAANNYISIEFGNPSGGLKGIVLPWVTSQAAVESAGNLVPGTLIYDSTDKKVKLGIANTVGATEVTGWLDLSHGASLPAAAIATANPALNERTAAKAIIGATTSSANGILVLETPDPDSIPKAMVLPRVNSYADIVNPAAGMIVYVTSNDQLAVFNGKEWTFWKGE